jgi:reverse gyrase
MDSKTQNKFKSIGQKAFKKVLKSNNIDKLTQKKFCDIALKEIFKDKSLEKLYNSLKKNKSLKNNKSLKLEKTFKLFKKRFKKGFIEACTRKNN